MEVHAFTVAIDGPAASGKGTVSRNIAAHFGFAHLDTGLLYRAVGAQVLAGADAVAAAQALEPRALENPDLRSASVAQAASRVAVVPEVRAALLDFQRRFARRPGGAVLDGRDIGTVICPYAEVKLFVTASDAVRAERRYKELRARGSQTSLDEVAVDLARRDARDASRDAAPMVAAADALTLDTTEMSIDAVTQAAITLIRARMEEPA